MRRMFVLIGLLLTVFVFPLILDVDAAFADGANLSGAESGVQVFGFSKCQKDLEKAQKELRESRSGVTSLANLLSECRYNREEHYIPGAKDHDCESVAGDAPHEASLSGAVSGVQVGGKLSEEHKQKIQLVIDAMREKNEDLYEAITSLEDTVGRVFGGDVSNLDSSLPGFFLKLEFIARSIDAQAHALERIN